MNESLRAQRAASLQSTELIGATRSADKFAGGLAAAHIQDTFAGLEPKIISRESAETLPHATYEVSASRWACGSFVGHSSRSPRCHH